VETEFSAIIVTGMDEPKITFDQDQGYERMKLYLEALAKQVETLNEFSAKLSSTNAVVCRATAGTNTVLNNVKNINPTQ